MYIIYPVIESKKPSLWRCRDKSKVTGHHTETADTIIDFTLMPLPTLIYVYIVLYVCISKVSKSIYLRVEVIFGARGTCGFRQHGAAHQRLF